MRPGQVPRCETQSASDDQPDRVASVLFGLAEIELEYRRERQAAGINVAKGRGVYRGRTRGTFKAMPRRAAELRARGLTPKEIGAALGVSERTAFRYLCHSALSIALQLW